jgi:serine/threonine protein phosphatase PrpC
LKYAGKSDVGMKRDRNEDSFNIILNRENEPIGFMVADGMGGHLAGEVASRIAVDVMSAAISACSELKMNAEDSEVSLMDALDEANNRIIRYSADNLAGAYSGTTLTAAYLMGNLLLIVHIGDSRAYCFSGDSVRQITKDHSYVAELLSAGLIDQERARKHPQRNKITKALGFEHVINADIYWEHLKQGDKILLCSDGLYEYFSDGNLGLVVGFASPDEAVENLIHEANNQGGHDNITAVIFEV